MEEAPPCLVGEKGEGRGGSSRVGSARQFEVRIAAVRRACKAGDGDLLRQVERVAALTVLPGLEGRAVKVLELGVGDPWLACSLVKALARRSHRLEGAALRALVTVCLGALHGVPESARIELEETLVAVGRLPFLRVALEVMVEDAPKEELAIRFSDQYRRLPPSARSRLDLDRLVARCLDRMGDEPLATWLDYLFDTIPIRQLRDDGLRERLVSAYAVALLPSMVQARHRARLFYLARYTTAPVTRAQLDARHDLAQLDLLEADIREPELVLERLTSFPSVLAVVPEEEAQGLIALVLRRLVRRLSASDHRRVAEVLCPLAQPEPFVLAYGIHLRGISRRLSEHAGIDFWTSFLAAWLSPRAGAYGDAMMSLVEEVISSFDKELLKGVRRRLKGRPGYRLELLENREGREGVGSSWRWFWPWGKDGALPN